MSEDTVRETLETGINAALGGEFVTKWLVIAESVGDDGKRGLWMQSSSDAKTWDVLGMIEFARLVELAQEVNRGEA